MPGTPTDCGHLYRRRYRGGKEGNGAITSFCTVGTEFSSGLTVFVRTKSITTGVLSTSLTLTPKATRGNAPVLKGAST